MFFNKIIFGVQAYAAYYAIGFVPFEKVLVKELAGKVKSGQKWHKKKHKWRK